MGYPIARKTRREIKCLWGITSLPPSSALFLLEYARSWDTWTQKCIGKELLTCIQVSTTNKNRRQGAEARKHTQQA